MLKKKKHYKYLEFNKKERKKNLIYTFSKSSINTDTEYTGGTNISISNSNVINLDETITLKKIIIQNTATSQKGILELKANLTRTGFLAYDGGNFQMYDDQNNRSIVLYQAINGLTTFVNNVTVSGTLNCNGVGYYLDG